MGPSTTPPDLTFGPPGDQWHYDRKTKTYDLTRGGAAGSPAAYKLRTTRGPAETSVVVSPGLTALVVVDMQNFFLHPRCREHPLGLAAVEPTLRVIGRCRRVGIQVCFSFSFKFPGPSYTLEVGRDKGSDVNR